MTSKKTPTKMPKITNWTPGNIKRLRKFLCMSQLAFAEKLGVTQATVCIWENGKSAPREKQLSALRKLYNRRAA